MFDPDAGGLLPCFNSRMRVLSNGDSGIPEYERNE
jgi:hypothetical protein